MMLLDVLDNLPRLRLSGSHFKMILWLLKKCGVQDVPSHKAIQKMQEKLRKMCGSEPKLHKSTFGNVFYVNAVRDAVVRVRCRQYSSKCSNAVHHQDFANPEVVKRLHFYPEETMGPISEVWQAERWKEYDPSERTPMYARGMKHFYINEISSLDDGQLVIPVAWIIRGGELCADCHLVIAEPVRPYSRICVHSLTTVIDWLETR